MNRCPAIGCNKKIAPHMVACKHHWFALPKEMRDNIWALYEKKRGSDEHREAVFAAIDLLKRSV